MKALLNKYNVPGPRYTSYPTVPAWVQTVGPQNFSRSLGSLGAEEPLSLYFHLPFCERLCHFCGCMQVITSDHKRSGPYVLSLLKELKQIRGLVPGRVGPISQIHFGGGTPNFLQPEEMSRLMDSVRDSFQIKNDAEIAIEMHPRTSTKAFCDNLALLGFNRISLGVQDFNPEVQRLIHRDQSYEQTKEMVEYLRSLGFESFNFDLIYGLPGQTMEGWEDTLEKVRELMPNRLAVYSYAHVPWVRPVQRSFKESDLPPPDKKLNLFVKAYEFLASHGYYPIGMDHFALADDELTRSAQSGTLHRNFMGYSTRADAHQIGLGVSAISYVAGNYFQNAKELSSYEDRIASGSLATFRGYLLNQEDTLRRDLIMGLMCRGSVDIPKFEERWKLNFQDYFSEELSRLGPFQQDGILHFDGGTLKTVGLGPLFLRNIAMAFDPYLEGIQKKATTPTFSKTV